MTALVEAPASHSLLADILETRRERYAGLITTEMRKTIRSARAEVAKCAKTVRYFSQHGPSMLREERIGNAFIRYEPLGTVLGIMPWNFPFWQVIRFAIPALIAGNRVIVKHSSLVPGCAAALEELMGEAGFGDVFSCASLPHDVVPALIADPRVRAVVVTAGHETGSHLASLAGKHVKKVILELGGSDAFIVMPSADLNRAVAAAVRSRLHCNGQACTAAKRFIVHREIADEFEHRFVAAMESVRVGDPFDERTELGPLATPDVIARLEKQVAKTIAAGATVLAGAYRIEENLYAPTVLSDVPLDSPAAQEETFGPVAALFRADDLASAIAIANNSRFGLGASVWTRDRDESDRCIRELQTGQVFINAIVSSDPALPFGGTKDSGYGRELGAAGIRELTNVKCVSIA